MLAQVWHCVGNKVGDVGTDQLLQLLQTRTPLRPGSLVCSWLMLELRVLSVKAQSLTASQVSQLVSVQILCRCTLVDIGARSCVELNGVAAGFLQHRVL